MPALRHQGLPGTRHFKDVDHFLCPQSHHQVRLRITEPGAGRDCLVDQLAAVQVTPLFTLPLLPLRPHGRGSSRLLCPVGPGLGLVFATIGSTCSLRSSTRCALGSPHPCRISDTSPVSLLCILLCGSLHLVPLPEGSHTTSLM